MNRLKAVINENNLLRTWPHAIIIYIIPHLRFPQMTPGCSSRLTAENDQDRSLGTCGSGMEAIFDSFSLKLNILSLEDSWFSDYSRCGIYVSGGNDSLSVKQHEL